jgi:AraC family transcriptional regulator of adaptative response / DNA-3-methyladenine glycosylase II
LPYNPPYDWEATAAFLDEHAMPGVESVDDGMYRRTVSIDGHPGMLEIGPGGADDLLLKAHLPYWEGVIHIAERAARLADPGRRVPGAWGPFEVAVGVIVRDQLAEQEADDVLRKLVEVHGMPVPGLDHGLTHAFPSAEALVEDELVGPLAREVAAGNLLLDGVESADVLERVPGVTARAARQVVARVS